MTALLAEIGLNIQEAHIFSTVDGYSLDVFVVDGWPYEVLLHLHFFTSNKMGLFFMRKHIHHVTYHKSNSSSIMNTDKKCWGNPFHPISSTILCSNTWLPVILSSCCDTFKRDLSSW